MMSCTKKNYQEFWKVNIQGHIPVFSTRVQQCFCERQKVFRRSDVFQKKIVNFDCQRRKKSFTKNVSRNEKQKDKLFDKYFPLKKKRNWTWNYFTHYQINICFLFLFESHFKVQPKQYVLYQIWILEYNKLFKGVLFGVPDVHQLKNFQRKYSFFRFIFRIISF